MAVRGNVELREAQKQMIKVMLENFQKKSEPIDPEKMVPETLKQKIADEFQSGKWTGGIDWAVEKRGLNTQEVQSE